MKYRPYCGKEYSDDVELCAADRYPLKPAEDRPLPQSGEISPQEQRFWDRLTFRQFAIIIVRLQALWLLFNALLELTLLPGYFNYTTSLLISAVSVRRGFFELLLRILLNVAAAIVLIQKAEKVLSWLVKDYVSEQPSKRVE